MRVFYICISTNISFISWAIATCNTRNVYFLYEDVSRRSCSCTCPFIPFPLSHSPLTFACTCQCCCPKIAPTQSGWAGLKQGGCQSPFLSQQHVHCLNLATVTHPVFPSPGDKRPPHQRRGMTLLSGMLKIPNLPTSVCEFKSPLLEAGLGLQLMTPRCRGSAHWWAGVLRHCASWVVHFPPNCRLLPLPSPLKAFMIDRYYAKMNQE